MILKTERLALREFDLNDSNFILKLVNSPNWLKFIGDKNIKSKEDAVKYLKNGPLKSYEENGYGLWLVYLHKSNVPIGMCGLVNRDILNHVDIGFALLPEYFGMGYGIEIAQATMNYAKNSLGFDRVLAITNINNISSIKLLIKIGLSFERTMQLSEKDSVLVFAPPANRVEINEIDELTTRFFALFTNANGISPSVKRITELFISNGMIINNTSGKPAIYNLQEFIAPREEKLNDGTLTDFSEGEIFHKTEVFGNIAQRFSFYTKSGKLNRESFSSNGIKTIQFVKVNEQWKISSVVWCDEN